MRVHLVKLKDAFSGEKAIKVVSRTVEIHCGGTFDFKSCEETRRLDVLSRAVNCAALMNLGYMS